MANKKELAFRCLQYEIMQEIKKLYRKWKWSFVGFLAIFISALLIRVVKLNLLPVFADEAIYVHWAQIMKSEPSLRFLPLSDGKQPLFMWLVIPALKLFEDPLIAGRMVSVASGMGTLVGISVLSYLLFKSRKVSLLASLFYAISPFSIFYDRMALVDSLLSMFGVWFMVFIILALSRIRLDFALLAGFSFGGLMLTKSPAVFFIVLSLSVLFFVPVKQKQNKLVSALKGFLLLGSALLTGYGFYNILRLGPNFHLIGSRNFDYVHPYSRIFSNPFDPLMGHMDTIFSWLWDIGPGVLLIMASVASYVNFKKFRKEVLVLVLWFLLPIVVQAEFAKVITGRYVYFATPPLYVLAASLIKKYKRTPYVYSVYAGVALVMLQSAYFLVPFYHDPVSANWPEKEGYLANWTAGTGIKEVSEYLLKVKDENPGRHIVVGTEGYFGTLPDGLKMYLQGVEEITVIGVGLGIYQIPEPLINAKAAGDIVYLAANQSRLNFEKDFSIYGLKEVLKFNKAPRDQGSHSYINDGPQDIFYLFEIK